LKSGSGLPPAESVKLLDFLSHTGEPYQALARMLPTALTPQNQNEGPLFLGTAANAPVYVALGILRPAGCMLG